jgi:predicted enzyme related to lactoylglutathione lyase
MRPGKVEIGIVVADLDGASEFYGDVLGLEYVGDLALPGGTMKRFQHGDAIVKLVRFDDPPKLANPPSGLLGGATGLRYLTIQVTDVDVSVERCRAAGRTVAIPTFEFQPGIRVAIVEDPEGNWVELTQPSPG